MWEIIGALFGGVYLAAKTAADRGAAKEAEQKREGWKQELDTWVAKVTNKALEDELSFFINKHFFDAADKARSLCSNIPEDQNNPTTYLRVLMAEHGKIPQADASFGIMTPFYDPGKMPPLEVKRKYRDFFVFVVCLRHILQRNAIDGEMFFEPAYRGVNTKKYYKMDEAGNVPQYGTYVWAPQRINIYLDKK